MKKKIILSIALMILCMSFSVTAFALTEGDWEFQLLDDELTITGYLGDGGDVVIPSEIYGRPVTKLEFSRNSLKNATSITVPNGIKTIKSSMCANSETLVEVVLPEGLETIERYAFGGCEKLESIYIPESVKYIGDEAFIYCESLEDIKLPQNVEMGCEVFSQSGIKHIDFSGMNIKFANGTFYECQNLESVVLPEGMTVIPREMFAYCTSLENIVIPNTVTTIESYAFTGCSSLENLILPTSLEILWGNFNEVPLKELVVPNGVKEINGTMGFPVIHGSSDLEAIYIPDSVTKIFGSTMIKDCPNAIVYCSKDSYAAEYCKKNSISYLTDSSVNSLITVYYNGTRVSFHEYGQNPELINSRTLVPLRAIFEAMDADVEWNQETKTVTAVRDGVEISISIGANVMYKDGESIAVDVPAQLINDRTMVPVRVIAEAFGADVEWNNNGRAVVITE